MKQATPKGRGFTLVELAVVMVVAAILVAIAVPGYQSYVRTARRTDAKTALLGLASLEERYFSTANAYSATATDLGFSTAGWPQNVGSGYYTVTVSNVQPATTAQTATYTITANVTGTQTADADCQSFTIAQDGTKSAIPNTDGNCWK